MSALLHCQEKVRILAWDVLKFSSHCRFWRSAQTAGIGRGSKSTTTVTHSSTPGLAGEWDALFAAAPKAVFHGRSNLRMYCHSFDPECGQFAIEIARLRGMGSDGKPGMGLGGGADGDFDEAGVKNGHVVRDERNGRYFMAFEGICEDGRTSIGFAVLADGRKRCGDLAVSEPSIEEDGWDGRGVGDPCLAQMDRDGEWRLYHEGIGRNGRTRIGVAVREGPELASFKKWMGFRT